MEHRYSLNIVLLLPNYKCIKRQSIRCINIGDLRISGYDDRTLSSPLRQLSGISVMCYCNYRMCKLNTGDMQEVL